MELEHYNIQPTKCKTGVKTNSQSIIKIQLNLLNYHNNPKFSDRKV